MTKLILLELKETFVNFQNCKDTLLAMCRCSHHRHIGTISQNYKQSKIITFLVVSGWLTCHTFCSLYGLYYNILQHVHVSAAAIHLHTKKRATGGKERKNCQKECL